MSRKRLIAVVLCALWGSPMTASATEMTTPSDPASAAGSQALEPWFASRNEESTPRQTVLPSSPAISSRLPAEAPDAPVEAILRVKAILTTLGYEVGRFDGLMTARLKAALYTYQINHGLAATGSLDQPTMNRLGIGVQ